MKTIVAVMPYKRKEGMHFLNDAFDGWKAVGGKWTNHWWQPRPLHYFIYRYPLPFRLPRHKTEARLMFVCATTLHFNTFADYVRYEVVPIIWDCWPKVFERTCHFFERHKVRTAVFTSQMMMERMQKRFPDINYLCIPEGINPMPYGPGKELCDRSIDLVEFGRSNKNALPEGFHGKGIVHKYSKDGQWVFPTNKELIEGLGDSKVSLTFPRCDTDPAFSDGIETLTQRYWECMLSRIVMVGRAPFELVELLGYNPVINIDRSDPQGQILEIVRHPEEYQAMVNKNREMALKHCRWETRMEKVEQFLSSCGYIV